MGDPPASAMPTPARPASNDQAAAVIALLRALVEHYADRPNLLPDAHGLDAVTV